MLRITNTNNLLFYSLTAVSLILIVQSLSSIIPVLLLTLLVALICLYILGVKIILNKSVIYLLLFQVVILLVYKIYQVTIWPISETWKLLLMQISSIIFSFSINYLSNRQLYQLTKFNFILIAVTTTITLFVGIYEPNVLRFLRTSNLEATGDKTMFFNIGLISYGWGHALVFLPTVLILFSKHISKKIIKITVIVMAIILPIMFFVSSLTTSFFLSISSILLMLYVRSRRNLTVMGIIFIFIMIVLFGKYLILSSINILQPYGSTYIISDKLEDIKSELTIGESEQLNHRNELRDMSLNSILQNPLLGNYNTELIGGHNFIFDYISFYGILGFFPFLISLFYNIKYNYQIINPQYRMYYILSILPMLSLTFLKAAPTYEFYFSLYFLLPLAMKYLERIIVKQRINLYQDKGSIKKFIK